MNTGRDNFLMAILECGIDDLRLIDGVKYDWRDIIDRECLPVDINVLMEMVIRHGYDQIEQSVNVRIDTLRSTVMDHKLTEEQSEELRELDKLRPHEDFEAYYNWIDTHVWCVRHEEIYKRYLMKALDSFADGTGIEIDVSEP